jgi:hypothetical protein
MFALVVVLWRAHDVRRWLQRRDVETQMLHTRISTTRARVGALRSGKELMSSVLNRLTSARSADDFDRRVLESSELIRSLLALADDGRSSVELEVELATRYFGILQLTNTTPTFRSEISLEASHAAMPSGSLASLVGLLTTAAGDMGRTLRIRADIEREWLRAEVIVDCSGPIDLGVTTRLAVEAQHLEMRLRQVAEPECHIQSSVIGQTVLAILTLPKLHNPHRPFVPLAN